MTRHAPWAEGPADFAIGLRPIAPDQWFEGGEHPVAIRSRKQSLLAIAPERVWAETEGSRRAQAEAARLVENSVGRPVSGEPPLRAAAMEVADDLCLMERRDDAWTLTALSLSAGTFFTAAEVVGKSLTDLHGPVQGFGERLLPRVSRIFDHLQPGAILQRRNWTVINSDALHLPDPAPVRAELPFLTAETAADQLFVRVERQTLRRLPETGGLLFTIRVWRESLAALARDRERLDSFARAWRGASPSFRAYKQLGLYDPLVGRFLADAGVLASRE